MEHKTCISCEIEKPATDFYRKSGRGCLQSYCKPCSSARNVANKAATQGARTRRYYLDRKYGLTVEEANTLLSCGCAVCGSTDRLVIDHDHATGAVRAALCNSCNLALGHVADDPARLRALATYLEMHA